MNFWLSAREKALAAGLVLIAAGATSPAALVSFDNPSMDVFMYSNGFNRGSRETIPVFAGPVGANGSDDRLGQFAMGWDLGAAGIPTGRGAENYVITRVTLKAAQSDDRVFAYDRTYDGFRTYLPASDPLRLPDADTGRPIELYGLGLRNGFTNLNVGPGAGPTSFGESSPYGSGESEHTRNAFAYAPDSPRADGDVSESVTENFDPTPLAIGITADVLPGQLVPADTEFTFQLNLAHPGIVAYLQAALNRGQLGLTLATLHPSAPPDEAGEVSYPRFYTREYPVPGVAPYLEIEYSIIPEPSAMHGTLLGIAVLASLRAWRRRHQFE